MHLFLHSRKHLALIDKFRYIKIQANTIDFGTRLWEIKPHKLRRFSPEPGSEFHCFRLNFIISKLVYFAIMCKGGLCFLSMLFSSVPKVETGKCNETTY